jgi:hypothetical protein
MTVKIKNSLYIIVLYLLSWLFLSTLFKYQIAHWYTHTYYYTFLITLFLSGGIFYYKMPVSSFYSTFKHELCHWFMGVLFFNKPYAFNVGGNGEGYYQSYGKGNIIINLAPYFLPITTLFLLLLQVFFNKPMRFYYILIGISLAFDIVSAAKDYHRQQTDWKISGGTFVSIQFSLLMAIIFLISVLTILFNGFGGFIDFLPKTWRILSNIL